MWFWIFMFIMNLLIPLIMVGFGILFMKTSPKDINMLFGYRSNMSMKNKETWAFAHNHCGKSWKMTGLIMLAPTIASMLLVLGRDIDFVGIVGLVITGVQLFFLIGSIIPTEMALRKNFDKNGNRRVLK